MLRLWKSPKVAQRPPPPRRARLNLESRLAPAILSWSGAVSNLMSLAGNYVGGVAPVAFDQVIFDVANNGGGLNVGFISPHVDAGFGGNLLSLQLNSNYNGIVTLDRSLTVSDVTATVTLMTAAGQKILITAGNTLTVTTMTLTGTSVVGEGKLNITGTALAPGKLELALAPTPVIPTIGVATMNIDQFSAMVIDTSFLIQGVTLTNNGAIIWNTGDITTGAASTVTNNNTFNTLGGNHDYAAGADFTNHGLFKVSGANLTFNSDFTHAAVAGLNPALVSIEGGNLRLTGTDTVSAEVSVGGALYITGTCTANGGASITGAGTVEVNGGAGMLSASAGLNLVIGPLLRLINSGDIRGAGSFQLSGGLLSINGEIRDTTVQAAAVNLSDGGGGTALTVIGSTVQFAGGTWSAGDIPMSGSSELDNVGVFAINLGGNATMNMPRGDTSLFRNTNFGTVTFAGAGTASFSTYFISAGTITAAGRTVKFNKGLSQTGGTVTLGGGTFDFLLSGPGYTLSGGIFKANGKILGGDLTVTGGTLELSGVLALTGNLSLGAGGTLQVDTDAVGPWGRVDITGTATLGGTLTVALNGGVPPAQSQTMLTATGGAAGNFAAVPAGWQVNKPNANTVQLQKL